MRVATFASNVDDLNPEKYRDFYPRSDILCLVQLSNVTEDDLIYAI